MTPPRWCCWSWSKSLVSRLLLEYDGSRFAGWARQPGLRTIQDEVERALGVLLRVDAVPLVVAGRTDAGVHAWGQVASYLGPPVAVRSVNALLPDDVAALSCVEAGPAFDARRDATSRAYCYRVLARGAPSAFERGRALHFPRPLALDALSECAAALVGEHDFTAFTPTDTYHARFVRQVFAAYWRCAADVLEFWIEADAFMRQMNRVLVGTMLEVASGGSLTVESVVELLSGRPRSAAGRTAPAHGLYLAGVGYGGERVLRDGGGA
ncbi:MAG: tRNA pseudouridine synthase A [Solirubrobacterales bacterium]|nr:tRNA pseudouridine synthase A [Solirubrobacterales bacterium]